MLSNEIKLTDEVVIPVMEKHSVSRKEAELRLQLLFKSGILEQGTGPEDNETNRLIDDFLAQSSDVSVELVLFHEVLTQCLSNKMFIRQYDRLTHSNLSKALIRVEAGHPPKNFGKQLASFGDFVRETVFNRIDKTTFNGTPTT